MSEEYHVVQVLAGCVPVMAVLSFVAGFENMLCGRAGGQIIHFVAEGSIQASSGIHLFPRST